jgi:adenylosuccinate lyase
MDENLNMLKGLIFSGQVLMKLTAMGLTRQNAYDMVQRNALKVWNAGREFKAVLLEDQEIREYLTEEDLDNIFSLDFHLKHVEDIFERVFV